MDIAFWFCLIPLVWSAIAYFVLPKTVSWREAAVMGGAGSFLLIVIVGMLFWSNTSDTEILNGHVTNKKQVRVSCSHSYSCNCRTVCSGTGDSRSCSTQCDTCYEHPWDWDWSVYTSVGNLSIERVDRRGKNEPPRWTAVQIGEPAARPHRFTNYVKAAPHSLFNMVLAEKEAKSLAGMIPRYPAVFDYYRVHHALDVRAGVANLAEWDAEIDRALIKLGASKQANILVVFVTGVGREYKDSLERAWAGGKKNDVVVVVGVNGVAIEWVESFTFGKTAGNAMLAVRLRDELQALETIEDPVKGVATISALVQGEYTRRQMEDYKYLAKEAGPSDTQLGWTVSIMIGLLIIASFLFHRYDPFGDAFRSRFNMPIRKRRR